MKKVFLFASLIAMVAVLATSCKSKEEAPKALFSYSDAGLEVTFQNLSKNADSFVWNFGDGETSTEKDPVHVYADYGDYTVTLTAQNAAGAKHTYEEEINLVQRAIVIDGDFSDWEALGNDAVARCLSDDDDYYDGYLGEAKFVRDEEFIYFYMNISKEQDDFDTDEGVVHGYYAEIVQFCLNCGDETTGCHFWYFEDPAIDILIECPSWQDQFESASFFVCPEALNGGENENWEWDDAGIANAITSCEAVELEDGRLGLEGKISILKLPVPITDVLKMGVVVLDPAWTEVGSLPEKNLADGATAPLVVVPVIE
ncbi:MAG: PKD domain-containing protein [Paludibacteraceae bacterium]|nr:PKD domain-containing protein [Paludibacteraceae bacterium]